MPCHIDDEQRVESMIADGRQITQQAIDHYKPIAIMSAFSGGNDSIVSTHFGCSNFSSGVVHCNTGIGVEKTRHHIRNVCAKNKWNLSEYFAKPEGKRAYAKVRDSSGKIQRIPCDGSVFPGGNGLMEKHLMKSMSSTLVFLVLLNMPVCSKD